jgi:hypothetical protein
MGFIKYEDQLPKWSEILRGPGTAKLPDGMDGRMMVTYSLAARVDEASATPVLQYVERLPKDFGLVFAKSACKRDPQLVNTRAFGAWCIKNAALMAAVISDR